MPSLQRHQSTISCVIVPLLLFPSLQSTLALQGNALSIICARQPNWAVCKGLQLSPPTVIQSPKLPSKPRVRIINFCDDNQQRYIDDCYGNSKSFR